MAPIQGYNTPERLATRQKESRTGDWKRRLVGRHHSPLTVRGKTAATVKTII